MTLQEVNSLLKQTRMPVAYGYFNKPQKLPYILYRVSYSNNFGADNVVYHPINHMQVELYTKDKDLTAEGKVEQALSSLFWQKSESYIEDQQCNQVVYEIEV